MIRHHHEFAQLNLGTNFCGLKPFVLYCPTITVQRHFTICNIAKQAFPVLCTNGDKISACLRIIVPLKADTAAVTGIVVRHNIL